MQAPGFWDAADAAAKVSAEHARSSRKLKTFTDLERDADGRAVVVDLKTGSSKPSRAELARHPQLGVYQLAVALGAFA